MEATRGGGGGGGGGIASRRPAASQIAQQPHLASSPRPPGELAACTNTNIYVATQTARGGDRQTDSRRPTPVSGTPPSLARASRLRRVRENERERDGVAAVEQESANGPN
ncbi:hypothetical protein EYF80_037203 [Liparis tanakae]|uniref:Uncharacterized protein n=1 Tax=Liparis tanakae TaxID=230148 RepID=A0A4Z2GHJ1_9TELE|nr:hypothetical protein EYF80_037203 [Liparis tanakae]